MELIKRCIVYTLALAVWYLGIWTNKWPYLLFFLYAIDVVLMFLWVLNPLLKTVSILHVLRNADHFQVGYLLKLLVFTWVNIASVFWIKLAVPELWMVFIFWGMKIAFAINMEIVIYLSIFYERNNQILGPGK